jgi:GGDEF domain-containing protein
MNVFTEWPCSLESRKVSRSSAATPDLPAHRGTPPSALGRHPVLILSIGFALVASHFLVVVLQPSFADNLLYAIIALSILLCGSIAWLHGLSTAGTPSLRWHLFALALGLASVNYFRASLGASLGTTFHSLDVFLEAAAATVAILTLTLPTGSRGLAELSLDLFIALFFCAFRIVYLHLLVSPKGDASATVTRFTFDSGIGLLLGIIALVASSRAELAFFRSAVVYLAAALVSCVCTNQIGFLWLHQHDASPWSLTSTALRVGAAIYLLHGLTASVPIQNLRPHKVILRSLVPFAMSCMLVWLSTAMLPAHRHLGQLGITVGVIGFLMRTALAAAHREHERAFIHIPLHNPPMEVGPTPLHGVENRAGFRLALARASSAVAPDKPVSLLLFGIDDAIDYDSGSEHEDDHLIVIARNLGQWSIHGGKLCYLGNARFAMLLPATSFHIGSTLAEKMCASVENIHIVGSDHLISVSCGVATAMQSLEVNHLLSIATGALIRAQILRGGRRRMTQPSGERPFEC